MVSKQPRPSHCLAKNCVIPLQILEFYNGIPYKRIVEELILQYGGAPQVGNRENTVFRLASDLAKITDRSAPWLESLIPTFGLPEAEWRQTIAQVCKKPLEASISRKLQEAIKRCEQMQREAEMLQDEQAQQAEQGQEAGQSTPLPSWGGAGGGASGGVCPPAMPERLPKMVELLCSRVMERQRAAVAMAAFPALATYVSNAKFFAHDNKPFELSLMAVVCGESSCGKGEVRTVNEEILRRMTTRDKEYRRILKDFNTRQKNKKANERGTELRYCPIQHIYADCTRAAFLQRLSYAQEGDGGQRTNLPTFTLVEEVQGLYKFCADGGKLGIQQMICEAWDRTPIGAERATNVGVNADTRIRWNWVASTTFQGCRKFFDSCITGGEVSRVMFCPMLTPEGIERDYQQGYYDKSFRDALRPYIDNLEAFHSEVDEDGEIIPTRFPEIDALTSEILDHMYDTAETMPDKAYFNYGKRTVVMAQKLVLVCYIANGCQWEDTLPAFIRYAFDFQMWAKLGLFGEKAAERFEEENLRPTFAQSSPLTAMSMTFTTEQFADVCRKWQTKKSPAGLLACYKNRKIVERLETGEWTFTEKGRRIHRK